MHETVPPAGTAIWEMFNALEESEGHTIVRPLSLQREEALLAPKRTPEFSLRSRRNKCQ
jgi:hypothetical protein